MCTNVHATTTRAYNWVDNLENIYVYEVYIMYIDLSMNIVDVVRMFVIVVMPFGDGMNIFGNIVRSVIIFPKHRARGFVVLIYCIVWQ